MFDLFRSRAKAVRYLLGALLLLVALSMVVTLIPGFVGASYAPDNIVAKIGDEVLTTRDVQLTVQQRLRSNSIPREMVSVYVPMIVNQMISERAVAYQAERMGFRVTDEDVARTVQSILPQLFSGGKFAGKDVYAQFLAQNNLTIPEFEASVRQQMLLERLMNLVVAGQIVTDEEIEAEFRRRNEKIKVEYVSFAPNDYRATATVTPQEIKDYYDQNKAGFKIPEKRDALVLVVDQNEVAKSASVAEEELRRQYQASMDRFRTPERVKVRHILLKTTDKSEQEKQEIKAKAEDLLKQIKAGADFAELAKKYSEDPGTASNGGELDWITHGQTVESFEKTAFSLKPGEISGVITTEYGFHIVQVLDKEPARLRPFEEVKDELAKEAQQQFVFDRMQSLADQARAELVRNPLQGAEIARKLGVAALPVNRVGSGDSIPEIRASADMQEAIRTLPRGGVTPVYEIGQNRLGVAAVTEVYPERPAELADVEEQIRSTLVSQKTNQIVAEKRKQLEAAVKEVGNDLQKIARAVGLTVKTSEEFNRQGSLAGSISAAYFEKAFEAPEGAIVGPVNAGNQTVVCKVVAKIPADMTQLAAERENLRQQLQRQKTQMRRALFEDGVLTELINKGKVKVYDRNIQRLVSLYKS